MVAKSSRKELKEPDAFAKGASGALVWAAENAKLLAAGAAVVVLLTVIGVYLIYRSDMAEQKASSALAGAEKIYYDALSGGDAGQLGKACNEFKSLAEKYSGTKAGRLALLFEAVCMSDRGDREKSKELLKIVSRKMGTNRVLGVLAAQRAALMDMENGKIDEALKIFSRLSKDEDTSLRDVSLFYEGKLLLLKGKKQEALSRLAAVRDMDPPSFLAEQAKEMIVSIDKSAAL